MGANLDSSPIHRSGQLAVGDSAGPQRDETPNEGAQRGTVSCLLVAGTVARLLLRAKHLIVAASSFGRSMPARRCVRLWALSLVCGQEIAPAAFLRATAMALRVSFCC